MRPRSRFVLPRSARSERFAPFIAHFAVALIAIAVIYARDASGDPGPAVGSYALSWTRSDSATGCAGAHELAMAVEARLHSHVFASAAEASFFIEGRIDRSAADLYVVQLVVYDRAGTRRGSRKFSKTASSCLELVDPLSLILGLVIDPRADLAVAKQTEAPTSAGASPGSTARDSATASETALKPGPSTDATTITQSPENLPHGVGVEMDLRMGLGVAPQPAVGLATGILLPITRYPWVARLGASIWLPSRGQDPSFGEGTSGAWFDAASLRLAGCREQNVGRSFRLLACAGVEPGIVRVQGFGYGVDRGTSRPTLDGSIGLASAVRWGPIGIKLEGNMLLPILRDEFYATVGNRTEIFRRPFVGGVLAVGVYFELLP